MARIIFYIDGFNLYYGIRNRGRKNSDGKPTPTSKYKWLDLVALCKRLVSHQDIVKIKYFTARIEKCGEKTTRQSDYLRIWEDNELVDVVEGKFLRSNVKRPLANGSGFVEVIKTEEKGTDVNLASHLLIDGITDKYDCAAIISNDSDFAYPIEFVKNSLKKAVFVFNPQWNQSATLEKVASVYKKIYDKTLKQLPQTVILSDGKKIECPQEWKRRRDNELTQSLGEQLKQIFPSANSNTH